MESRRDQIELNLTAKLISIAGSIFGVFIFILFYALTESILFTLAIFLLLSLVDLLVSLLRYKKRRINNGLGPIQS